PSQRLLLRKGRPAIPPERRRNDQIAAERLRLAEQGEGRKSTTKRIADQHTLSWIERILLLEMRDDLAKQRMEISRRSARAERQRLAQAPGADQPWWECSREIAARRYPDRRSQSRPGSRAAMRHLKICQTGAWSRRRR